MILLYYALLLLLPIVLSSGQQLVRNEDICGPHNGRRLYVELGERGVLRADNVSLVKNSPQLQQDGGSASGNNHGGRPLYATTNSSHDQCSLELVTCPSCVISVVFRSINLQHHCGDGGATVDSPCRCDYVWISEPPYEDVSGTPFCGHYAPMAHRSNTRTLSIALLYSQSHSHAFSLEYTAERNRLILTGSNSMNDIAKSMNNTGGGTLASPFFPSRYPRDMGIEYIISCPTEAPVCRVRVLFSDFQVAAVSVMEFYDWNGQRLDVSSGARFRPPIIVSTGPSLLVRFYANGGTGLGYKAFYSFVFTDPAAAAAGGLATVQPVTDCGGYVENLGGTITMMDMVGDEGVRTYDCVWLIKPPKNFLHTKTHMYVKVISFAEMAGNTELIIKQGPTSALMPLEVLRHPVSQLQPPKLREHLAPVSNGFHVSLRGSFGPNSRLAIAYAAFSYIDCFAGSDFLCQNHRCISSQLNCDGFDHCGDSSDEPATCMHDMDMTIKDQKWHQSKANYYFPKIDRYPDLKTATMVFVISSLGLIIMISTLIIMLYRIGSRARQQRELQSRLRTISELLDGARIDEMSVNADEPPVYEAPPNYDEVIKLGMENETAAAAAARRKRARRTPSGGAGRRSRSVPSQCSCEFESHLTINAYEGPSNGNLGSDAPQSASSSSSTTAILPAGSESPPPPYVTPPKPASPIFRSDDNPQPGPSGLSSHVASSSPSSRSEANCRGTCRHRLERRNSSVSLPAASREASTERLTQNDDDDDDDLLQQQQRIETSENVLGAYNASSSSSAAAPADACAAPQLPRSSAASACTSTECAATCCSADVDTRIEAPVRRGRGPPQPANVDASRVEGCLCEGACGCASLKRARALLRSVGASKTIDHESAVDPTTTTMTMTRTLTSPNVSAVTQAQRQRRQLFFAVDDKNQADETTNILDRVPSSSSSSTCLKKNYASCDLDNLYESIKVLDTYLAKRTATSQDRLGQLAKRRRSMAAMLFDDDLRQPSEDDAVFSTPMTMSRRESRDNEPRP